MPIIGVDVGGTKIRAGLVREGKVVSTVRVETQAKEGRAVVLKNIFDAIAKVRIPGVKGVGLGMAGIVDHKNGVYLQGPNFPKSFQNVPISSMVKAKFGVRAVVDNDVHCFTLAEAKFGAGKGHENVVGLTFGTGIGGGIVIGGRVYRGRNNAAGEIGHTVIAYGSDVMCSCGRPAHFEAYASGSAMSRLYRRTAGKDVDALTVERAAIAGDKKAKEVMDVMADALAVGLANVIHAFNPDVIVTGGGLSAVKVLWKPVLGKMKGMVVYPLLKTTPIVRSTLGGEANVIGAALLLDDRMPQGR
jgi:glucokinase